jgi:hypothetical protein
MRWPALRFERAYEADQRRRGIESALARRDQLVAAIWANPTWDDKENADARKKMLSSLDDSLQREISIIRGSARPQEDKPDPLDHDPLFRPFRRQRQLIHENAGRAPELLEHAARL